MDTAGLLKAGESREEKRLRLKGQDQVDTGMGEGGIVESPTQLCKGCSHKHANMQRLVSLSPKH